MNDAADWLQDKLQAIGDMHYTQLLTLKDRVRWWCDREIEQKEVPHYVLQICGCTKFQ